MMNRLLTEPVLLENRQLHGEFPLEVLFQCSDSVYSAYFLSSPILKSFLFDFCFYATGVNIPQVPILTRGFSKPCYLIAFRMSSNVPPTFLPGLKIFEGSKMFFVSWKRTMISGPYICRRYGVRIIPSLCSAVIEP